MKTVKVVRKSDAQDVFSLATQLLKKYKQINPGDLVQSSSFRTALRQFEAALKAKDAKKLEDAHDTIVDISSENPDFNEFEPYFDLMFKLSNKF